MFAIHKSFLSFLWAVLLGSIGNLESMIFMVYTTMPRFISPLTCVSPKTRVLYIIFLFICWPKISFLWRTVPYPFLTSLLSCIGFCGAGNRVLILVFRVFPPAGPEDITFNPMYILPKQLSVRVTPGVRSRLSTLCH